MCFLLALPCVVLSNMSLTDDKEKNIADTLVQGVDGSDEASVVVPARPQLHRKMKNRHIAMIGIGGVIGTGLFLGTATGLSNGGPVGLFLGYCTIGSLCFCVMISLGEMASLLPIPGAHITFSERFIDSSFSFTLGWMYWYSWAILLPAEISAAAVLINYWNKTINDAVWISIFLIVVVAINSMGPGVYGEVEFIFCSIKIVTIVGLIILGIVLDLGGGPTHDRIGFRYWKHPAPFAQYYGIEGPKGRFFAFWAVLTQAAFSFTGTEIVAIAGAEVKNPRRNIPRAIRRVWIRICFIYIGGATIVSLLVPYTDYRLELGTGTAAASPFVIAIQTAGIKVLPSIINAVLVTSAWSAGNSDIYCSSRALFNGNAPKIFTKLTRHGLPWVAVLPSVGFGCLAYMSVSSGSNRVFGWLSEMTAIAGLGSWFCIAVTYLRFHKGLKAQGIERNSLPYRAPFQPYAAYYAAVLAFITILFSGWSVFLRDNWSTATFVTNYLPLGLFPVSYVLARLWKRKGPIKPEDMDFVSGIEEVLAASYDEPPPRNWVERIWGYLM
ncbi:amino acid permease [Amylocystis lapponica]|nr:amino acid permease [Amylocystis lapponica]